MPVKKKRTARRKAVSGQKAADRLTNRNFFPSEIEKGRAAAKSLDRARKELAIGVKPSSSFRGGLSGGERGMLQKLRKGKRT